jgi:hypothetical protein
MIPKSPQAGTGINNDAAITVREQKLQTNGIAAVFYG